MSSSCSPPPFSAGRLPARCEGARPHRRRHEHGLRAGGCASLGIRPERARRLRAPGRWSATASILPGSTQPARRASSHSSPSSTPRARTAAQGSGFVVSKGGYILTSAHVITDAGDAAKTTQASSVFVGFKDGDRVKAEIVGWDVYDDVGLLRVDPSAHTLSPVPLGDSSRYSAGDPVAAMGSPFGKEDSIAVGVVSAVRRSIESLTSLYKVVDAIQIDAPITHGNSGGPLFDARGRVIGINAQIRTDTGDGRGRGLRDPDQRGAAVDAPARCDRPRGLRLPRRDDREPDADSRAAPGLSDRPRRDRQLGPKRRPCRQGRPPRRKRRRDVQRPDDHPGGD